MLKRLVFVMFLATLIGACAQLGGLVPEHESPYTRAIDALASSSGTSTFLFARSQELVHFSLDETATAEEIEKLLINAMVKDNGTVYFIMKEMQKVNDYINANPANYDAFLEQASLEEITSVAILLVEALNTTKIAVEDLQKLKDIKPEGKDALYAQKAADTMDFAASSQQAQLTALSTLVPKFTNYLANKGIDVSSLVKNANAASQITDFLK